ncbi:MAG: phosphatase PAP2 family protein [Candidatus Taylorbacteria bacterium]|nr:phosphatase PAP2 family protein [Candidatus Taylorbacteria bacterium]
MPSKFQGNSKLGDVSPTPFLSRFIETSTSFSLEVFLLLWFVSLFVLLVAVKPDFLDFSLRLRGGFPVSQLFLGPFFYGATVAIFGFSAFLFSRELFRNRFKKALKIIFSLAVFALFLFVSYAIFSLFLRYIFVTVPREQVIAATNQVAALDSRLFHGYPAVYLRQWFSGTFLDWFLVFSYQAISPIMSLVFAVLFFFKPKAFRTLLLSFILSGFLCLPFWAFIPAIAPQIMYRQNNFGGQDVSVVKSTLANIPQSPYLARNLKELYNFWFDPTGVSFSVSSFPSAHAAYGLFAVLALWSLSPILGGVSAVWYLGLIVGAVYLEQHFAVDMVAGIFVGFAVYWAVAWLLKKEEDVLDDRFGSLFIYRSMEEWRGHSKESP